MHRHFFRLIVLLILCTVYCTTSNAQVFKKINITQTGYGQTASSALINAKTGAVRYAIGSLLKSDTELANDSIALDKIISQTNGAIKDFKIKKQYQEDSTFVVVIDALVYVNTMTLKKQDKSNIVVKSKFKKK